MHDAPAPTPPASPTRSFVIRPPIGDKPGFIWFQNDDGSDLGRVYLVKMKFGREVERVRMTKHFKKQSAKQVRDEFDPIVGNLLFNEREHGALTEQTARDVVEDTKRRMAGPRRGPPRGGRPGGPPRGGRPGGHGGGGGRGPHRGPPGGSSGGPGGPSGGDGPSSGGGSGGPPRTRTKYSREPITPPGETPRPPRPPAN